MQPKHCCRLVIAAILSLVTSRACAQLYVSDTAAGVVRTYDSSNGAPINAALISGFVDGPTGIALDGQGNLYVASGRTNGIIGKYDAATGAAINPSLISGLTSPSGVTIDAGGSLYVVSNGTGNIGKYEAATGAPINPLLAAGLPHPFDVAVYNGHAFVTTYTIRQIWEIDSVNGGILNNQFVTPDNGSGLSDAIGIIADGGGHLFVASSPLGHVSVYDAITGATVNPDLPSGGASPYGIALDPDGAYYVSDYFAGTIGKFDANSGSGIGTYPFISGLSGPTFIAIAPEPAGISLGLLALGGLLLRRRRRH